MGELGEFVNAPDWFITQVLAERAPKHKEQETEERKALGEVSALALVRSIARRGPWSLLKAIEEALEETT